MQGALVLTAYLLLPTTSHADGYLSHYSRGGSHYTQSGSFSSRYGNGGGYSAGSQGSSWNYGGAHAPIERKHRAAWQQRQRNHNRTTSNIGWNLPRQNTWATRYSAAWFGVEPGAGPSTYGTPCGNYQRAPASCNLTTTRYNPLIHGSR